jgi:hypothetical protein
MHRVSLIFAVVIAALGGACNAPHRELSLGSSPNTAAAPIRGEYIATIKAPLVGEISARMTAEPFPGGFTAITRPNIAWNMIGGIEGLFGPLFVRSIFPDGVILVWVSNLPDGGKAGDGYIGPGESKRMQVRTRMGSVDGPADIYAPDGKKVATLTLRRPGPEDEGTDYGALAAGVERAFASKLYDPGLMKSGAVRSYLRHLSSNARMAHDDVEFIFGAVMAARAHVSSFALPLVFRSLDAGWMKDQQLAELGTIGGEYNSGSGIGTVKVDAFVSAAEVDRVFKAVLEQKPRGLVVDLSNCPGVTLASLRAAAWVVDRPTDAGVLFGPAARAAAMAGQLGAPEMALDSAESVERIESQLDEKPAARVTVMPAEGHFTGPVAVLIGKRTTTSAEALAWTLKAVGDRVKLFGQATAGRPTLSRPAEIGAGWTAWLPALDYEPPAPFAGERTSRGCAPDVEESTRGKATQAAVEWLKSVADWTPRQNAEVAEER